MEELGFTFALVVALVGTSSQTAAQPSFAGTWKLNLAKSQMTGQTLSVEKTASGLMHFDIHHGFEFDFDLSGKEFPTPDGGTTSWREINPTTWEDHEQVRRKGLHNLPNDLERRNDQPGGEDHPAGGSGGGTELLVVARLRRSRFLWQVEINRDERRTVDPGDRTRWRQRNHDELSRVSSSLQGKLRRQGLPVDRSWRQPGNKPWRLKRVGPARSR